MSADPGHPRLYRPIVRAAINAAVAATLALFLVVLILPAWTRVALRAYLIAIGAIAAAAAIRAITARYPVLWRASIDVGPNAPDLPEAPARLRAIERLVSRAEWDPAGFQTELRPILRDIAAQRLATYRTIAIEREPDAARDILGERVWALLAPTAPAAVRGEGGIDPRDLRAAVETLETLDVVHHP